MTSPQERRLGQARAELVALPDLLDELQKCLTEKNPQEGGGGGKPGSRAPLRLEVLHLTDDRRKPGWEGDDPRTCKWSLNWVDGLDREGRSLQYSRVFTTEYAAWTAFGNLTPRQQDRALVQQWRLTDEYGVAPMLEQWTRVLAEEMPERPDMAEVATARTESAVLVEHWDFIADQQWADELVDDVLLLAAQVRAALGQRKEQSFICPTCGARAYLRENDGWLVCDLTAEHSTAVRDLEQQQRRRPPQSTAEIAKTYPSVNPGRLYQWHKRKKIEPTRQEGNTMFWLPWDVFCLLNPDLAEALDFRDETPNDTVVTKGVDKVA